MKKIIYAFGLLVAFQFSANAQETKKAEVKTVAINTENSNVAQINELDKTVTLNPQLKGDLISLLAMRDETVAGLKTDLEKKAVFERFGKKLMGGLTDEQKVLLSSSNPELLKKLTIYSEK